MSTLVPISPDKLKDLIVNAVETVFETMMSRPLELTSFATGKDVTAEHTVGVFPEGHSLVVSAVGFTGEVCGILYLYQDEELAKSLTGGFLGMTADEVSAEGSETIHDVLGELANMIGGTFKNRLCDMGMNCRLTIPSIVRGTDFRIESPPGVERFVSSFHTSGADYVVEVLFKPGDNL